MPPNKIGRFEVIDELGRGAQGVVYRARDPRLDRQVAIKTLRSGSAAQNDSLLREARTVSNLQHPNIVPLYDLGLDDGTPYLVYAMIDGETVAQVLKRSGPFSTANAARITASVLDALSAAHDQKIMHLDIKPGNVMISGSGQHLVMDFGIARSISQTPDSTGAITGTPQYMAPETISASGAEFRSDIFSAGMMLYEMVTGTPAVASGSALQILNRNANEKTEAPSSRNSQVDEKLEWIILKALAKRPEDRFQNAQMMRKALLNYLDASKGSEIDAPDADFSSTLRFLLRRMRSKSDFPALSGTIHEINKIVASETEGSSKLAQAILQDYSLTNKLLKLVNTVSYSQFGGQINTISKAVSIVGFESVRSIATSLILMDFLQNKSQADDLKDDVVKSFFTGIVAVQLSDGMSPADQEEMLICSMFLNLGRLIAKYYFFEESQEITRLMVDKGIDEEEASHKILGVSYNELGIGIAKTWNFPARLVAGMKKFGAGKISRQPPETGQLSIKVNLANELCALAAEGDTKQKKSAIKKLHERYEGHADASEETLSASLEKGLNELTQRSQVLGLNVNNSPSLNNLRTWLRHAGDERKPAVEKTRDAGAITADLTLDSQTLVDTLVEQKVDPDAMLSDGIQDVTNTLVGEYKLNDVLQMVLESIYRSLGFRHVLIFSRDVKQGLMIARFGFGETVGNLLPHFRFPLTYEADVFHLALEKGLDIVIDDVSTPSISSKIPAWYTRVVDSRYFLLLPIVVNKVTVGMIYADMLQAKQLQLSAKQLSLLRTLRNQAVLAIKQKTS